MKGKKQRDLDPWKKKYFEEYWGQKRSVIDLEEEFPTPTTFVSFVELAQSEGLPIDSIPGEDQAYQAYYQQSANNNNNNNNNARKRKRETTESDEDVDGDDSWDDDKEKPKKSSGRKSGSKPRGDPSRKRENSNSTATNSNHGASQYTWISSALKILQESKHPLHAKTITEMVISRGILKGVINENCLQIFFFLKFFFFRMAYCIWKNSTSNDVVCFGGTTQETRKGRTNVDCEISKFLFWMGCKR